jgi:hypothetical protein
MKVHIVTLMELIMDIMRMEKDQEKEYLSLAKMELIFKEHGKTTICLDTEDS